MISRITHQRRGVAATAKSSGNETGINQNDWQETRPATGRDVCRYRKITNSVRGSRSSELDSQSKRVVSAKTGYESTADNHQVPRPINLKKPTQGNKYV